jgi:hypothetical protein
MRRLLFGSVVVAALVMTAMAGAVGASARADELAAVRAATARFHDFDAAEAAGYGLFYVCTDEAGLGAMGQHYVNGGLVGDTILDPAAPEAIMYEPLPDGGQRLVGVEWVVFQEPWQAAGNTGAPSLFGRSLRLVSAPNRYGIPSFYQLHAWVWKPNPEGAYQDWNPRVSCRGNGD